MHWRCTQNNDHTGRFVISVHSENTVLAVSRIIQSGNDGSCLPSLHCGVGAMMAAFSPRVGADCSCVPERTRRTVLFNRVPKCGSSTFEKIIDRQSRRHRFQFVRSHDFVNNSISETEQLVLAQHVDELGRRQRVLYDRHIFFVDFSRFGVRPPLYINLVRDPLKMQVSAFYFWKDCMCRMHKDFCRSAWQDSDSRACRLTMDEVYAKVNPVPTVGVMTRFFCGQEPECRASDPAPPDVRRLALQRATSHLHRRYAWVGVLEQFRDSLEVLSRLMPEFFGGMNIDKASLEHVRPSNSSLYSAPSNATLAKLAIENGNDLQLYTFATQLLQCRLRTCREAHPFGAARARPSQRPKFKTSPNEAAKQLLGD